MKYETFVVQRSCLGDPDGLEQHSNVRRVIRLPGDFVLYEFHDELLDLKDAYRAMQGDPQLREARRRMMAEYNGLLAPFHAMDRPGGRKVGKCLLGSSACPYWIYTMKPVRWPHFDFGPFGVDWDRERRLRITLDVGEAAYSQGIAKLLDEWSSSGRIHGSIRTMGGASKGHGGTTFDAEFNSLTGHWIAALFALLSAAGKQAGVSAIRLSAAPDATGRSLTTE